MVLALGRIAPSRATGRGDSTRIVAGSSLPYIHYITDKVGDGRRFVFDRNTSTIYLTNEHYNSWLIIEDPWIHNGPAF